MTKEQHMTSKTEMTLNNAAVALLLGDKGKVAVVQHGAYRLFRLIAKGDSFAPIALAPLSRKNRSTVRFRLDTSVVEALNLKKGKYTLQSFDMTAHTVRARWARSYPREGWVAVSNVATQRSSKDDTAVLSVL
jgi:hypothetical protein